MDPLRRRDQVVKDEAKRAWSSFWGKPKGVFRRVSCVLLTGYYYFDEVWIFVSFIQNSDSQKLCLHPPHHPHHTFNLHQNPSYDLSLSWQHPLPSTLL